MMDLRFQALALLPKEAPIQLDELAKLLGCHEATIKRNEKRGILPKSFVGFGGKRTWIVGNILTHLQALAQHAMQGKAQLNARLASGA